MKIGNKANITGKQLAFLSKERLELDNLEFALVEDKLADAYSPKYRTLILSKEVCDTASLSSMAIVAHELGHAVDFNGKYTNTSSIDDNQEFMSAFNEEMEAYIAQGGKKGGPGATYATTNEEEMFAECYTLLMLGNCGSKDIIVKFFPKTLKAVEKHIEYVRSLPTNVRA